MSRYTAQLAKLIIYNSQKSKGFVSCFVTQPKLDEERLGQIFIITEIKYKNIPEFSGLECQKFIDTLIKIIKNNYYYKNKSEYESEPIELLFEAALQKTNREVQAYLLQKGTLAVEAFLDNANMIIGVAFKHQVHFAAVGNIEVFLARKNKISNVLAASNEAVPKQVQEKINLAKIFSHLISGNLETDDGLFFATPNLLDYFSLEKIKRIIGQNSATKASQTLAELLAEIDEKAAIAGIVIKLASGREAGQPKHYYKEGKKTSIFRKPAKKNAQDSIAELLNRQEETNKIIAPSLKGIAKKLLPRFKGPRASGKTLAKTIKTYEEPGEARARHLGRSKKSVLATKKFLDMTKSFLNKISARKPTFSCLKSSPQGRAKRGMGLASKAILVICIIFGIVFVQSLFSLNKQRVKEESDKLFAQEIEKIIQARERANTRLIIGDKASALDSFEEILDTIKELSVNTLEQKAQLELLKQEVEAGMNELNKVKKMSLKQVVDLGSLSFFKDTNPEKMVMGEKEIYIVSDDGSIHTNNLETGEIKELLKFNLGKIKKIKRIDEENLIIKYNSSLARMDIDTGAVTSLNLESREDLEITDFEVYNNRLYILDANKNLILKYSRSENGFNKETSWLKDDTNIREGVGLAIDGAIWILQDNGIVIKLIKGAAGEFVWPEIKPGLIRPSKIWTSGEAENVYFMDAATKRIIALTKQGEIKQQYAGEELEDFKDFVVNEKDSAIYILDGLKIYKIEIN